MVDVMQCRRCGVPRLSLTAIEQQQWKGTLCGVCVSVIGSQPPIQTDKCPKCLVLFVDNECPDCALSIGEAQEIKERLQRCHHAQRSLEDLVHSELEAEREVDRLKTNLKEAVKWGDWARAEETEAKGALVVAQVKNRAQGKEIAVLERAMMITTEEALVVIRAAKVPCVPDAKTIIERAKEQALEEVEAIEFADDGQPPTPLP